MAHVDVVFYRDDDGSVPLVEWLAELPQKVRDKCLAALEMLEEHGYELRRPVADYLRDGVYELRIRRQSVNYRMLYFFHGRDVVVVSHGLVKERAIPPREIELAMKRQAKFAADPRRHTFVPED